MSKDDLGDRIKGYESVYDFRFTNRLPIVVRIDGKAFHSWTKKSKCQKPFDLDLIKLMQNTTKFLCENISGCVCGYCQSDEISLLLINTQTNQTQPWFDNRLQKIVSVVSSLATCYFNENNNLQVKIPAFFDSRAFVVPEKDILNYFIWRQRDAIRNSISTVSHSFFSPKELHKKNSVQQLEMCKSIYVNWEDFPNNCKKGSLVYKVMSDKPLINKKTHEVSYRKYFIIDENISLFEYNKDCIINKLLIENNINIF